MHTTRRIVLTVVVVLLVVAGAGAAGTLSGFTGRDGAFVIDRFDREVTVDDAGDLQVIETLAVTFREPRRGIFRDLPREGPAGPVSYDGFSADQGPGEAAWNASLETADDQVRLRIGDPDVELSPGTYTYRIGYRIQGLAFTRADDPQIAEVRLDIPGLDWPTDVGPTTLRVSLPGPASSLECVEGARGDTSRCDGTVEADGSTVLASLGPFAPGRTATVAVALDADAFRVPPTLSDSTPLGDGGGPRIEVAAPVAGVLFAMLLVLPIAVFETLTSVLVYRDEETDEQLHSRVHPIAVPGPPFGLRPAEVAGLLLRRSQEPLFLATLVDLDQRGLVMTSPTPAKKGDGVRVIPGPPGTPAPEADRRFLDALLPDGSAMSFDGEYDPAVAKRATAAGAVATSRARKVFQVGGLEHDRARGLRSPVVLTLLALAWVVFAVVAGWAAAVTTPLHVVAVAVIAVLVVLAWSFVRWLWRHHRLPLNSAGRDAVARSRSFEEYLRTVEAEQLEWASGQPGIDHHHPSVSLLPYAIALGLAGSWFDRFGEMMQRAAVTAGGAGAATGAAWWADQRSFESVQQARTASVTDPSSSGGGGGGAGSGGGGGGGGSW